MYLSQGTGSQSEPAHRGQRETQMSQLGWAKDTYGYMTCLMCKATVSPTLSSMLAHVDANHREPKP